MMKSTFAAAAVLALSTAVSAQTPCVDGMAGPYPCEHMDLLAHVTLAEIGNGANTNDIWGWVSPVSGREYALVGCDNGTAFLDISTPTDPVYLGLLPTHTVNSLWRDVETYNNYCFVGSEAPGHGIQIMDLLQLDEVTNPPVTFEEDEHYGGFGNSHTINIDPASGMLVAMGTNTFSGGLHFVNVSDPLNPILAGGFSEDGYTHDGFILTYNGPDVNYQGHIITVACNEDALTIVDCTDPSDCIMLDSQGYNENGYTHQGWFTKDYRYFLVDDELDEMDFDLDTRTHIFDLQSLDQIDYMGFYQSTNTSIDHNLYVLDQFVYESNYRSGVRVLDAVHVADGELTEIGFFDLYPANDNQQFSGTWSNYPYLPSGVNIATSMYDGFFITMPTFIVPSQKSFDICGTDQASFDLTINADLAFPLEVGISGLPGSATASAATITGTGTTTVVLGALNSVPAGNYDAHLVLTTTGGEEYLVPLHFSISAGSPVAPALLAVPDGSEVSNTFSSIAFGWEAVEGAIEYTFQLASDASFTSVIDQQVVDGNGYTFTTSLPDGDYFWRVRTVNACGTSEWSDAFSFTVLFISVNEVNLSGFSIYPNPATEIIQLRSHQGPLGDIRILDLTGKSCFVAESSSSTQRSIDISHLAPGVYFVKAGMHTERIVVR